MSMIITPGPLPPDGEKVNVESMMDDFINATELTNFGPDELNGDYSFIYSQTEAPSILRGRIWFKRGEGQFYIGDIADRGLTEASEPLYLGWAPRREIWGYNDNDEGGAPPGTSEYELQPGQVLSLGIKAPRNCRYLSSYDRQTLGVVNSQYGNGTYPQRRCYTNFVAAESSMSGMGRIVESGFCNILMASGVSGANGDMIRQEFTTGWILSRTPWGYSRADPIASQSGAAMVGYIRDPAWTGIAEPSIVSAFKVPWLDASWSDT